MLASFRVNYFFWNLWPIIWQKTLTRHQDKGHYSPNFSNLTTYLSMTHLDTCPQRTSQAAKTLELKVE